MQRMDHIVVVPPIPDDKRTYIIGDVHGSDKCLEKIINELLIDNSDPDNRVANGNHLFIGGDLTDRGRGSKKVIDLILDPIVKDKIFVVRGNHEELVLNHIAELEKQAKILLACRKLTRVNDQFEVIYVNSELDRLSIIEPIFLHFHNGGKWLHQLFLSECGYVTETKIFNMPGDDEDDSVEVLRVTEKNLNNIKIKMEGDKIIYDADSKIKLIKDFFSSLPYIIHVPASASKQAFNIVHAYLPFHEKELLDRLKAKNYTLSPEEIDIAIWARSEKIIKKASPRNTVTYCGHNIVIGSTSNPPVRPESKSINLDIKTYGTGASLVMDHNNQCFFIYEESVAGKFLKDPERFEKIQNKINKYVETIKKITNPAEVSLFFKPSEKEIDTSDIKEENGTSENNMTNTRVNNDYI